MVLTYTHPQGKGAILHPSPVISEAWKPLGNSFWGRQASRQPSLGFLFCFSRSHILASRNCPKMLGKHNKIWVKIQTLYVFVTFIFVWVWVGTSVCLSACLSVCLCAKVYRGTCVKVRRQLMGLGSLFHLVGPRDQTYRAWWQSLFPAEPSWWPLIVLLIHIFP